LSEDLSDGRFRLVAASSVSLEEYAAAFTHAFSGYRIPIVLDARSLASRVRLEQYALEHSLVAYEGEELAGVAALAVRAERAWVAGLGLVPRQRGRGRGRELMAALVERARGCGVRRLSLEVLAGNTAARRLYESAGMKFGRDLLLMERAGAAVEEARAFEGAGPLKEAAPRELLTHFARLHVEPPSWPRDLPTLLARTNMRGFHLGERAAPDAYVLLSYGRDGYTYIMDLAAAEAPAAEALCAALAGLPGTLKIVNEPEHSLFTRPLVGAGFRETDRQHEMETDI
jgi:GNAT superfamily N-acetyltransferase